MAQNDILHTMKEGRKRPKTLKEEKCHTPNKNIGKNSNSGSSRNQSKCKKVPYTENTLYHLSCIQNKCISFYLNKS